MSLTPGATLGPYAIRAELGHGGMGVVYTAHDPRLKRQVAIKLLVPDLTRDETAKRRFLQEAQAASALDHPNHLHDLRDQRDTRRPALPRDKEGLSWVRVEGRDRAERVAWREVLTHVVSHRSPDGVPCVLSPYSCSVTSCSTMVNFARKS